MLPKPVGEKVIYPELSYTLLNLAFAIHNTLGPGFTENIYQAAFEHELTLHKIAFESQKPIRVCYKGAFVGDYRLDLVVEQKVVIELKAVALMNELFKLQLQSYLKAGDYRLGLLIYFGSKRLQHSRIIN